MFELILQWVADHILAFLSRRVYSGKWRWSHLLPVVAAAFLGIWWLGEHWDSIVLTIIGMVGAIFAIMINLVVFIPRRIGEREDFESYIGQRRGSPKNTDEKPTGNERET